MLLMKLALDAARLSKYFFLQVHNRCTRSKVNMRQINIIKGRLQMQLNIW